MGVYIGSTARYLGLDSWVLAKIIQLSTYNFCRRYFTRSNDPDGKQFSQTTGAARAVPANIAEGSARHQTSIETEMRLLDVARASLSEVLDDLMFVIMSNGEAVWADDDPRAVQIRAIRLETPVYGKSMLHDVSAHVQAQKHKFDEWIESQDLMVCANALIILCLRVIKMLRNQMEGRMADFRQQGGFSEKMTETRLQAKCEQNKANGVPNCPKCGAVMVRRVAKKGARAGQPFWSCSNYHSTGCIGILPFKE